MSAILGLEADFSNLTFTRLGHAAGKAAGTDFDQYSMYGGRRRCNLTDSGIVTAYYGDPAFTETGKLQHAVTASGVILPAGTCVQVMVEQPKFYYRVVPLVTATISESTGSHLRKAQYWISDEPIEGYRLHPAFVKDGGELDYIYLSAYEGCRYYTNIDAYCGDIGGVSFGTDKLSSVAGYRPLSGQYDSLTRANARTLAHNRGSGWELSTIASVSCSQLLMTVEYGVFHLQEAIGKGVVNFSVDESNQAVSSGGTASLGNHSGMAEGINGQASVSYRGEENFWGNIWTWVDGVNIWGDGTMGGGYSYICTDGNFLDDTKSGNYENAGFTNASGYGYISAFGYSEKYDWLFLPSETTNNYNLSIGDYTYSSASRSGYTAAQLGGRWNSTVLAGPYFWNIDTAASTYGLYAGARLTYFPKVRWIYNRTQQDVANRTSKGHYNAADLNRVGSTMSYIASRLNQCGYKVSIYPKTDWSLSDIPTQTQMKHYLDDLETLRSAITVYNTTPATAPDMLGLTWQEANDIEQILKDIDRLITDMTAEWHYSDELFCGEVINDD